MAATRFDIGKFDGVTKFQSMNVDVKIDNEDHAMLLLCFLPFSNKSFRETLIYGRNKLSFEDMKGHFLSKEKLDNEFGLDNKPVAGFDKYSIMEIRVKVEIC
ncbi:hypothetical protein PVK06_008249 [Gossypium arboreum]|uniref:MATH domain-containing protein n=1 Tax=Gossypium arboreum TaxID=29729 RepID=A0ABR0QJH5_GOSAR|nr:hypothetical protein PVK06_008249 [Gossypium arboreum]